MHSCLSTALESFELGAPQSFQWKADFCTWTGADILETIIFTFFLFYIAFPKCFHETVKNRRWDTLAAQKAIWRRGALCGFSMPVLFWWVGEIPPRSVHASPPAPAREGSCTAALHPGSRPRGYRISCTGYVMKDAESFMCWPGKLNWLFPEGSIWDPASVYLTSMAPRVPSMPVLEVIWHCSTSAKLQEFALSYCMLSIYFSSKLSCLFNVTFLRSPRSNSSLEYWSLTQKEVSSYPRPFPSESSLHMWSACFGDSPNSTQCGKSKTCHSSRCRIQLKDNAQKEWFLKSLVSVTISL